MKQKDMWNTQIEETMYTINVGRKEITVVPGETFKIRQLSKKSSLVGTEIYIPVGNTTAHLHRYSFGKPVMVVNGKDCDTGLEYEEKKMPAWVWIFIILHAINFFLIIGGALGGALDALLIMLSVAVAANVSENVFTRVLKCGGIYVLATVLEVLVRVFVIQPML